MNNLRDISFSFVIFFSPIFFIAISFVSISPWNGNTQIYKKKKNQLKSQSDIRWHYRLLYGFITTQKIKYIKRWIEKVTTANLFVYILQINESWKRAYSPFYRFFILQFSIGSLQCTFIIKVTVHRLVR